MLKIGLLLKQVPLQMKAGADGLMDRSGASQINPYCKHALEEAIKLKQKVEGSTITVFSMGPPFFEKSLREAISMGADEAVLLSDRKLAGSDTMATAKALSKLILTHGNGKLYDVIFAGLQTVDGDTAHVPAQVAERLNYNQATYTEKVEILENGLKVQRLVERGTQILYVPFPAVLSVTNTANTPRGPYLKGAMLARRAEIKVYSVDDIGVDPSEVGLNGSPTVVAKVKNVKSTRILKKFEGDAESQVRAFFESINELVEQKKEGETV
jgi:electron transfer flavoprotein beta subunit